MSCNFKIGCIAPAIAWLCAAQPVPPDEIRSRTEPYVLPSAVTLHTEVRVVEVPVVVRDDHFRAVAGLTRDDFEVYDDGKKQAITVFSAHSAAEPGRTPQPRFLALCFDDLHLPPARLQLVKNAAERFVKTGLAPGDRVAVVRTSRSEASKFTSDAAALVDQIENVTAVPQLETGDSGQIHMLPHEAYQIANHLDPGDQVLHAKMAECSALTDPRNPCREGMIAGIASGIWDRARSGTVNTLGVIASVVESMAKLPGQRVVLLTSAGFLTGTLATDVDRLTNIAQRADVMINSVDARGQYSNVAGGTAYDGAGVLASGTGGTFFHNDDDLEKGFREMGMAPAHSYMLGFAPAGKADGSFHKLKVQLTGKKGYSVEARLGYTATASAPEAALSKLDREVMGSDTIEDLPASFKWEQWEGPPGVTTIVHLDIGRLHFKPWEDRQTQKLTIVAVVLDKDGGFVAGKRSELQLSFRDATYRGLAKTGFTTAMTIKAPPGSYRVRAVALDALEGKLSAASGAVEIK